MWAWCVLNIKQFFIYLVRWQLSTLILAPVVYFLSGMSTWESCAIANLIGGCIFFFIDRYIFTSRRIAKPLWEIEFSVRCFDCGILCRGYRLVRTLHYDRSHDKHPQFRCEACSMKKIEELRTRGVSL
jgi:hypothetical protein